MGLGSWYPRINHEYDLATLIMIRPLIQPRRWEMASSIFAAMSRLKLVSTIRASLSSMPPTERKHGEFFSVSCGSDYCDYPSSFYSTSPGDFPLTQIYRYPRQHPRVWRQLWRQSVCPISPDDYITPCIKSVTSLLYPPLWYDTALVDDGVRHIKRLKLRLVERGIWFCHVLFCDVRWRGFLWFIVVCYVYQRMCHIRHICSGA